MIFRKENCLSTKHKSLQFEVYQQFTAKATFKKKKKLLMLQKIKNLY